MDFKELLKPESYRDWILYGVVLLTAGYFFGGMAHFGAGKHLITVGNFFAVPGGVLLTGGVALAGIWDERLSNGVRLGAVIAAGIAAMATFGGRGFSLMSLL